MAKKEAYTKLKKILFLKKIQGEIFLDFVH